jgi:hypothetical protein
MGTRAACSVPVPVPVPVPENRTDRARAPSRLQVSAASMRFSAAC